MGNYHNIEYEFVERTMKLIAQYEGMLPSYEFEEQYNYTLMINCLLGLIVMPKERVITYIPTNRLTADIKKEIGLEQSELSPGIKTLQGLVKSLRHSIAHFDIEVISEDDRNLIDWIEFKDSQNSDTMVARFCAREIVPFLKYYSACLLANLKQYRNQNDT